MSLQEQKDEKESDLWQEWKICCHHSTGRTWDFAVDGVQWPNQKQDVDLLTGQKIFYWLFAFGQSRLGSFQPITARHFLYIEPVPSLLFHSDDLFLTSVIRKASKT